LNKKAVLNESPKNDANMKKSFSILIFILSFLGLFALARELPPEVTFPIAELGNCESKEACKSFCDIPENAEPCLDFAEAHDLIPPEEIEMARKMLKIVGTTGGPGGCWGQEECQAYCDIPANMEECIVFGIEHDLIPPDELEEAKMALAAIRAGATPPPCRGKKECDIYCSEPAHLEECVAFGIAAGFISAEEAEMIRKTGGKGPGNCRGKEECEAYCENPNNMEECINFGIQYGLMPPDEIEDAKKMLEALKKGVKPPPCRSEAECEIYCSQPEHAEECINFAEAAGFMTPEEAADARKMAAAGLFGQGPGGCKGKEECKAYCDNPDNMVECTEFALKAGLITPEEAEQVRKMAELGITGGPGGCKSEEECEAYCEDPANMEECMEFAVAMGFMTPEEAEQAKMLGPGGPGGPGGCKSKEECNAYCSQPEHTQECVNFGLERGMISPEDAQRMLQMGPPPDGTAPPPGGMMMPPGEIPTGPGGCTSEAECFQYCSQPEHIQECQQFMAPGMPSQPPTETMPPPEGMMPPPGEMLPSPPSETAPETLLKQIQKFLASVISILEGK
jgi:hypothetical protein